MAHDAPTHAAMVLLLLFSKARHSQCVELVVANATSNDVTLVLLKKRNSKGEEEKLHKINLKQ